MRKLSTKRKIIFSILFLTALISCATPENAIPTQKRVIETPNPSYQSFFPKDANVGDGGVLSGLPCPSPCAFGIQVGETQLDQVIPELEKNGITGCFEEPSVSWVAFHCGGFDVQVGTNTNLVNGVWFKPQVSISLADIIGKYGEPNFVTLGSEGSQEEPIIWTIIYWDSIRMLVEMPKVYGKFYMVKKTTEVGSITFLDEDLYFGSSEIEFGNYFKPWHGYGIYEPTDETIPLIPMPTATAAP
jgi:hypothetical protein